MPQESDILLNDIYQTKVARFNADTRLRLQHQLANYSIMSVSVYVVVLAISHKFLGHPLFEQAEFASIILSVFLIGIASFEAGNDRLKKAYLLHGNAIKMNALYKKYRASDRASNDKTKATEEYNAIEAECEHNHSSSDFIWHVIHNSYIPTSQRIKAYLKYPFYFFIDYGVHLALILIPLYLILSALLNSK